MFRTLTKSKIGIVLAILFAISMFFFRGGKRYSNFFNSDTVVAKVSGTPISTSKFNRTMKININQFSQILGKKLTSSEIESFQIQSLSLGALINSAVFENEFEQNKYILDKKVVAKITKERLPQLYQENNKLNEIALNSFLNQQGIRIEDLVNIIDFEVREEIFDDLFFEVTLSNKLVSKIKSQENQTRQIEYIKIKINELDSDNFKNINVNKESKEVVDYYNLNIKDYMSVEQRDISYILINKKDYLNQLKPSKETISKYYNENKDLYSVPEKRDFIQFNFKSKNDAENFIRNVKGLNKENILKFADKNKIIFNQFNDLSSDEVLEELSNEIFNLNVGEISKIIKSPLANHVIVINNIKPKYQQTLKEVKSNIEDTITSVELNNYFNELKIKLSDQIIEGLNLNEIAENNNLQIKRIQNIKKQNHAFNENLILNKIIDEGFSSNLDFVSDVIDYDINHFFILNVDKVKTSKPLEYDIVYEDVIMDWKINNNKNTLKDDLNKNLQNNNYIQNLSFKYSKDIKKEDIVKSNSNLSSNLINEIFNKSIKEKFLYFEKEDVYIVKINNILIPENYNSDEKIYLGSDLKNAFGSEIMKNKKISINDSLINALLNQY